MKERAYLKDVNVYGAIILKWTLSITCEEKSRFNN
jgi:hypothetical protein